MKNNKGITLVALVVTIIVLIILAGISINLILGDNGIITIAKRAKENIELAKIEEETELNELYTQLESSGTNSGENNYDAIAKLTEFKKAIANAIDEAGGLRPDSSAETTIFVNNIKGILKEVTKNATATAEDIKEGKTAWVNGKMIVGNFKEYSYLPSVKSSNYKANQTSINIDKPIDINSECIAVVSAISTKQDSMSVSFNCIYEILESTFVSADDNRKMYTAIVKLSELDNVTSIEATINNMYNNNLYNGVSIIILK